MLIPKFSIRQMLQAMVVLGIVSACMAGAMRGSIVAIGLSVAIVGLVVPFGVYACLHWSASLLAGMRSPVVERLFLTGDAVGVSPQAIQPAATGSVEIEVVEATVVTEVVVESEDSENVDG